MTKPEIITYHKLSICKYSEIGIDKITNKSDAPKESPKINLKNIIYKAFSFSSCFFTK